MGAAKNKLKDNAPKDQERRAAHRPRPSDDDRAPRGASDHGITKNSRGEDQPKDKSRAQQTSGEQAQRDASRQLPSPGEPAGGE